MTDLVTSQVPQTSSDDVDKDDTETDKTPVSDEAKDITKPLVPETVTRPAYINKQFPKSTFPHYSPLSTRSRKITSPTSSFPFSPVSGSDTISGSDLSDSATPVTTPGVARKRTVSSTSHDDRFALFSPPAPSSSMSRSSSTLSLCSNISQVNSSLTPVEKLLKHCK